MAAAFRLFLAGFFAFLAGLLADFRDALLAAFLDVLAATFFTLLAFEAFFAVFLFRAAMSFHSMDAKKRQRRGP
ncbi:MAG TPA: hypothetical protein VK683_11080 [Rhizomicrobium sp.]|nr:hypothetical protein [Rhizomicrobium sp.]